MPHGYPDWGQTAGVTTTYQLKDLAELAARLGSIVTFDRRGDVFFLEDFEHDMSRFINSGSGAGNAQYLSLLVARSGSFSARLVSGSDASHNAYIATNCALPSISSIGFEVSFSGGSIAGSWEMTVEPSDNVHQVFGMVKYDHATDKLYYYDAARNWIEFASGLAIPVAGYLFNSAKLVIDVSTRKYKRFIINAFGYDLSGIDCYANVITAFPQCYSEFKFVGQNGYNQSMYLDDWILTQNEP